VPATGAQLILRGSTITDPAGQTFSATPSPGSSGGDFTGSVTIPSGARDGDTFTVTARCSDSTGTSSESTGGPTFSVIASGLVGGVVTGSGTTGSSSTGGLLSGVLSGLLSGGSGGLTGGTSTGTSATGGFGGTTGSTTGVATPITATPTFTG